MITLEMVFGLPTFFGLLCGDSMGTLHRLLKNLIDPLFRGILDAVDIVGIDEGCVDI